MEPHEIEQTMAEVVDRFGPWTAHSIHLGDGLHTFPPSADTRLRRIVQLAADMLGSPLAGRRVLDLACLEGQLGIEFALHGSQVVGIEGREANLAKARFAKEVLDLRDLQLVLGDVRDLSSERHGHFDLVLCAGILYHLDAPDAMDFLERVADVCQGLLIIDTHVSLESRASFEWRGRSYWGAFHREHGPDSSRDERLSSLWYSLENERSFHFTRNSLCNILRHVGFTTVLECLVPYEYHYEGWPLETGRRLEKEDRLTLVAIKGEPQTILPSPSTDATPDADRPEHPEYEKQPGRLQRWGRRLRKLPRLLTGKSSSAPVSLAWSDRPIWQANESAEDPDSPRQ